jgi:hypothetical protein
MRRDSKALWGAAVCPANTSGLAYALIGCVSGGSVQRLRRICEGPPLAGRPLHCLPNAVSSGEPRPRGGGHAQTFCRGRHMTMRHSTTSFPLLTMNRMWEASSVFQAG